MPISVTKAMSITIEGDADLHLLQHLISLGLLELENVDRPSWGDDYTKVKTFGQKLEKIIRQYDTLQA